MGSVRCNSRSRFDCNLLLSCIYTKVFLLQEISEEDVDPEEVPETNSEHLKLPATKPEPVEKDKTGTGSVQTIGVKKYKKLVQKLVTQGPRKASNATDISVVFFFLLFFPSNTNFSFFVESIKLFSLYCHLFTSLSRVPECYQLCNISTNFIGWVN